MGKTMGIEWETPPSALESQDGNEQGIVSRKGVYRKEGRVKMKSRGRSRADQEQKTATWAEFS
jgi:hypothetical protein